MLSTLWLGVQRLGSRWQNYYALASRFAVGVLHEKEMLLLIGLQNNEENGWVREETEKKEKPITASGIAVFTAPKMECFDGNNNGRFEMSTTGA